MKEWLITGLAVIGGFAVFKWWNREYRSPAGQNAQNAPGGNSGVVSMVTGSGDLATNPLVSGIPTFNTRMIPNKPDQLYAWQTTNAMATHSGGGQYEPAFGANQNRGGTEVW